MSESYVETVPFESKYAWILKNAEKVRSTRLMHRIPTDVIVDLGQLACDCILDRPTECNPWDPQIPDVIDDIEKVPVNALVKSAVLPPLPYPQTFGGILKEQNERWVAVRADLTLTYIDGGQTSDLHDWDLSWDSDGIEELSPDDFLLMLAKETIQDNAKQEAVKVYDSSNNFIGFATLIDRNKWDRNIWKEQYVMKNLGLPLYIMPKAYQPTSTTATRGYTDEEGTKQTLSVTLEGADKIIYEDKIGSGATRSATDAESQCRCYTINAIVKPYIHVLNTPLADNDEDKRPTITSDDDPFYVTGGGVYLNWNSLWWNFLISDLHIDEIVGNGNAADEVDTCVAVEKILIDGNEATIQALDDILSTGTGGGVTVVTPTSGKCEDVKKFKMSFPDHIALRPDTGYVITLQLVWIYKVDILKMDILVNDDMISHIYCGEGYEFEYPETPPTKPVSSVYIESVNEQSS